MNTKHYLELAYSKWGTEDTLVAKRNIAIAEVYAALQSTYFVNKLTWDRVYFSDKPFIYMGVKTPLSQNCVNALFTWLEGLWSLYNQSHVVLTHEVFCRNLQVNSGRDLSDIEAQILSIDANANIIYEISRLVASEQKAKAQQSKANRLKKRIQPFADKLSGIDPRTILTQENPFRHDGNYSEQQKARIAARLGTLNKDAEISEELQAEHQRKLEQARLLKTNKEHSDIDLSVSLSIFQQDNFFYPGVRAREDRRKIREIIRNNGIVFAEQVA